MMKTFGYTVGIAVACVTVSLAVYAGMLYERHTAPEPCITNLSNTSYPHFDWEQKLLDHEVAYDQDSEYHQAGFKNSTDLAHHLVEMNEDSQWPSSIYTNPQNGNQFYVPGLCYVGDVDWFGNPVLYRR